MKNIFLVFVLFFVVCSSNAQIKIYNLNDTSSTDNSKILISSNESQVTFKNAKRSRELFINPVVQNREIIRVNDTILLDLFNDKQYRANIDQIAVDINGTLTIRAKLQGYNYGYCIISTYNGKS
jgi:hypothetical protein